MSFDQLDTRGGFDDLLPSQPAQPNGQFAFLPIEADNPFADMQSSQYMTPPSNLDYDYSHSRSNDSDIERFQREDAPEPEAHSYIHPTSPATSYTSPSTSPSAHYRRPQDPSQISDLLGDPTPILPTFRSTFKPSFHPVHKDNVLPISSIGHRPVGGNLATLLGLEQTPSPIPVTSELPSESTKKAVATTATIDSSTATIIPLPASTVTSRTPSLAASARSATSDGTRDGYTDVVSPIAGSDDEGGDDTPNRSDENGLESRLSRLDVNGNDDGSEEDRLQRMREETVTPNTIKIEQAEQEIHSTLSSIQSDYIDPPPTTTSPQSPFGAPQSPFSTSAAHPESIEDIPVLTYSTSPHDDTTSAPTTWGFRSFNDMDEPMNQPDAFASMYHQSEPSAEGDAPPGFGELPPVPSDERSGVAQNSPPLPLPPTFDSTSPSGQASTDATSSLGPSFIIAVGDPQKVGSSLNVAAQHTVYTVRTKTTSSAYRKAEFSVLRRFSHFLWLFDALTLNNPGVIVPGMPEKSALGRFGSDFVENRRSALQAALMKMVGHPMLVGDPDLRLFLESDTFSNDIKQRKVDSPAENKGFLASLGNSISGTKFHEVDEYFDTRRQILDAFETQLRLLLVSLSSSSKLRATLQSSIGELQAAFIALASCDLSGPLRNTLEKGAGLQGRLKELSEQQSTSEEEIGGLTSTAEGYARLCGSVKLVFSSRVKAYGNWQSAENHLKKVRSAHEKAKKAGRTHSELLGLSLSEISEAERRSNDAKRDFEDVGKLVKAEMARFDKEKVEDFKRAVEDYADGIVLRQRLVVIAWQEYADMLSNAVDLNIESSGSINAVAK